MLNENRGSTLEVVVSRMKARYNSLRFLMVSATVPNIHDIANWISTNRVASVVCKVFKVKQLSQEYTVTRRAHFSVW